MQFHPDDEPAPRFGKGWANDFNTYADACRFYGCDTPADVEAEMSARDREEMDRHMDDMEASGVPFQARGEIPF